MCNVVVHLVTYWLGSMLQINALNPYGKKEWKKIPTQLKKWIDSNALYYLNTVPVVSGSQVSVRSPE